MSQTPSIGRIVHYRDNDGNTHPAMVVYVDPFNDNELDLHIMTSNGAYAQQSVFKGEVTDDLTWSWPPYTSAPEKKSEHWRANQPKSEPPTLPQLAEIIRVMNFNKLSSNQMAKEIIELFEGGSK